MTDQSKVSNTLNSYNILNTLMLTQHNMFVLPITETTPVVAISNNISSQYFTMFSTVLCAIKEMGYRFDNSDLLFKLTISQLEEFLNSFITVVQDTTKTGKIFRKTFLNYNPETGLGDYLEEERTAVLAQYMLTYGKDAIDELRANAGTYLNEYISTISSETIDLTDLYNSSRDVKSITLLTQDARELSSFVHDLATSKKVLTSSQVELLQWLPQNLILETINNPKTNFRINEIKILFSAFSSSLRLLSNATDILKYIAYKHANMDVNEPIEGQLLVSDLANHKIKIPTTDRKKIVRRLAELSSIFTPNFLTEDMYKYPSYWKIIDRKLRWGPASKMRTNFPAYCNAIDLLYENDRSWTFNGRYSAAVKMHDFDKALNVAAEKPGHLLRNLVNLIRYERGDMIAVKEKDNNISNTESKDSSDIDTPNDKPTAQSDCNCFIKSTNFYDILLKSNTKLLFQLREELLNPNNHIPVTERIVQGQTVKYAVPVPGLNKAHRTIVISKIDQALKVQLSKLNSGRKIYLDSSAYSYPLSYSGRDSLTSSYTGKYLPKNHTFKLDELSRDNIILRVGILWRSANRSTDLDHNVSIYKNNINNPDNHAEVYYRRPVLQHGSDILAVSSGDITECGDLNGPFSVEFVDLDIRKLKERGYKGLFNSLINFSGGNINDTECYVTMQVLPKRNLSKNRRDKYMNIVSMNLNQTDYAIRLDESANSYLGLHLDLETDKITVLSIPVQSKERGNNAEDMLSTFINHINNVTPPTTLESAFSHIETFTNNVNEADVIISTDNITDSSPNSAQIINPLYDFSKVEQLLFTN